MLQRMLQLCGGCWTAFRSKERSWTVEVEQSLWMDMDIAPGPEVPKHSGVSENWNHNEERSNAITKKPRRGWRDEWYGYR